MKLDGIAHTTDELVLAWPATSFRSAEEVLDALCATYPSGIPEGEYEYYVRMVEEIIEGAEDVVQE